MEVRNIKQCIKCKEYKPLTDFNKDNHFDDGLYVKCRECANEYRNMRNLVTGYTKKRSIDKVNVTTTNFKNVILLLNDIINQTTTKQLEQYTKGKINVKLVWK